MKGLGWVLGLSAVLCLTLLPGASYAAALPLVLVEWGLNATEAGLIFSAYQIGYVAATLVLLPLTDRVDARRMLIAAAALSAVGNALFPLWASDFASGALLRFAAGLTLVGVYVPGMRVIAAQFPPERRGGPVGLYVASFYVGTNLSVLLSGLLLPTLGWRGAYLATVALAAAAPLVGWLVLRGRPAAPAQRTPGRLEPAVLRNGPALMAIGAYAAHTWELYAARGWLVPFLAAALLGQGYSTREATALGATLAGVAFLLGTLSIFGSGFLSDRFGRTRTAGCFLAGSALCSLSIGWLAGWPWWALFAFALLYGLCIGADSPIYSTAVTELAEPARLGSTLAVHSFLGFLGGIVGPVAFGALLDRAGPTFGWQLGFGQAGGVALLGVALLLLLRRHPASLLLADGKR